MKLCFHAASLCLAGACVTASPQATDQVSTRSSAPQSTYTLHTATRIVLTDVTVQDSHGNPVRGLSSSAFHILDNKKPQVVASFEEHTLADFPKEDQPVTIDGVATNSFLLHPPPVFNIIMLDTSTITFVDQMYLSHELKSFVDHLPPGQMLAVYVHAGEFTVGLQNFTADHALLHAALEKAIPRLAQPGAETYTEMSALRQIAGYLAQLPGHKNILWFSGGSNLLLRASAADVPVVPDMRAIYDMLETDRIALYPIDVRGPIIGYAMQQLYMREQAEVTGGTAFLNTNGLAMAAAKVVEDSSSFYTLTYHPSDFKFDNKWHKVKIEVEGGNYTLSYRRGYCDDGSNPTPPQRVSRTLLKAGGDTVQLPANHNEPIIFSASLRPGISASLQRASPPPPPKRGEQTFFVHFSVPASAFTVESSASDQRVKVASGIVAFNSFGRSVNRSSQQVLLTYSADRLKASPGAQLAFDQQINLPKGQDYLYVAVWDVASRKMGTLQLPVDVKKP